MDRPHRFWEVEMQRSKRAFLSSAAALALAGICTAACVAPTAPATNGKVVTATWQHHHVNFSYFGITTLYSCTGLENNIRSLLLHFGARKDAKVTAQGCPQGPDVPGRQAIIDTDFYSLTAGAAPNSPSSPPSDAVQAQWVPVVVSPRQPYFMSGGDCELIYEMKDLISNNFSLRDLDYRTDCVPHEVNIEGFSVKAQALKARSAQ
jgi:hypothetical protein